MNDNRLKKSELHVHLLQSLYPEDIFQLAKNIYNDINWNRFNFLDRYEEVYGIRINPINIFEQAINTGSLKEIEDIMTYKYSERGDFEKFNIKSHFPLCITGYYMDKGDFKSVIDPIIKRHKKEGISYIEYRQAVGYSHNVKDEWKVWHKKFISCLKDASDGTFQAKYIMRITENSYNAVREFVGENPDLKDTIVGIDFTGRELPPKSYKEFFENLDNDNRNHPEQALDVVVHIGEDFFDKSLESAIRWCHETAKLGAKRLGHCIALGLAPEIAIKRRPKAHIQESVSERIDQIEYDLKYIDELKGLGVKIDREKLLEEKNNLSMKSSDDVVCRKYDNNRLQEIMIRQDFVLDRFKEYGTVIEVCPTSNLRIGGISDFKYHPFRKFYETGVNIAICTDDPGIFNSSLSSEVDLIAKQFDLNVDELEKRIGDPYQYRLGQSRIDKDRI